RNVFMNKRTDEKLFSFVNSSVMPIITMQPGPIKSNEKIREKTFLPSIDKRNAAAIYKILTHQKQRLLAND
ncbi:hypothetical protein, partial [Bacillus amyloliquefaciens]|uniref:hypothetical protein n=1 Tax=Bacillus amyloliquefaciens TaxID=1390 RepID=UPI00197B01E0